MFFRWASMFRDGWRCEIGPSPLVPRDPPKGRVRSDSRIALSSAMIGSHP